MDYFLFPVDEDRIDMIKICDAMDYFLFPVDEDRIDMEKQWELGMAQPNPFKFERENMRPWLAEFLRNSFVTGQTLL